MRLRVARGTERLADIIRFYGEGLALPRLGSFEDHDGYSGVIFGAPDHRAQVEFTTSDATRAPPPAPDTHLVLYYDTREAQAETAARLVAMGYEPAVPRNPWWQRHGDTFLDPDGWEVVLVRPARAA